MPFPTSLALGEMEDSSSDNQIGRVHGSLGKLVYGLRAPESRMVL
jgi:hypothetical protein